MYIKPNHKIVYLKKINLTNGKIVTGTNNNTHFEELIFLIENYEPGITIYANNCYKKNKTKVLIIMYHNR